MRIAVASGKGGTGKTTVATNLAVTASRAGLRVGYLDCDVEEPNGALFLRPQIAEIRPVVVSKPSVDPRKCNGCGWCGKICQFVAIVAIDERASVFPELCHGCGGCRLVCPTGAITDSYRQVGQLALGTAGEVQCVQGLLSVGEAVGQTVIAAVKEAGPDVDLLVIDSPSGTSCSVIESVRGSDLVLLVAEPTPFGLKDLALAVEMVRAIRLSFAVVINRANIGDGQAEQYCREQRIDVLAEIPDDRRVAEAYSQGRLACDAVAPCCGEFEQLFGRIDAIVADHARGGRILS